MGSNGTNGFDRAALLKEIIDSVGEVAGNEIGDLDAYMQKIQVLFERAATREHALNACGIFHGALKKNLLSGSPFNTACEQALAITLQTSVFLRLSRVLSQFVPAPPPA